MTLNLFLLIVMALAGLWTVMARNLLKATIGLALTSAIITILMFRLESPLAAVFELSVCTGLITVVFATAISLTRPMTHKELVDLSRNKLRRYWYLPVIMILAGFLMVSSKIVVDISLPEKIVTADVREILWDTRQLDLFGQILILLTGAFGIVILFKTKE